MCVNGAWQNDIIEWSRDHRLHHKYSETDADPHNAMRGFFFSHCGWLMVRKHPEVKAKGKQIDMSDLYNDPVCSMQRKYATVLLFIDVKNFHVKRQVKQDDVVIFACSFYLSRQIQNWKIRRNNNSNNNNNNNGFV